MPRRIALVLAALSPLSACGSGTTTPPPPPACTFALAAAQGADAALTGTGSCEGTVPARLRVATGDAKAPTWTDGATGALNVEGAWRLDRGLARREVIVRNTGVAPVPLVALEWTLDTSALRADRMVHVGYQSWSYTGVEEIPASLPEERGTAKHSGGDGDVLGERGGVSWWYGAVGRADGVGLVAGADGAGVLRTYVAADGARVRVVMGAGESLVLAPGESRTLDGVVLALGDVIGTLDAFAGAVAAKHPPARPRKPALGGWGSWNLYYDTPTAAVLRDEMAFTQATLAPQGMKDFLLDDGYEPFWGDWTDKPEFGAELGAFAGEQTAAGLVPAIWLAPFCVDVRSQTFAQHPDWLVQDDGGQPKTVTEISNLTWAALDVTNDAARAHLEGILSGLWAKGYRTFKLDYLYAGALEGKRQKPVTSMEALALGFRAMREAAPDAHLVGCGAPQLPSVGSFDSMRTGPDIAFKNVPEPRYGFALAQARHTALRAHTDAFWFLDPDVVLLRGTAIDDTVAWAHVVSMAMTGGNWLLGDGRQASEARRKMALLPDVLAMVRDGVAARPMDGLAQKDGSAVGSPILDPNGRSEAPHLWKKRTKDDRTYVAVFAWGEDPYAAEVELPAGAEEIGPDGATKRVAGAGGKVRVEVPLHAVRLFRAFPTR